MNYIPDEQEALVLDYYILLPSTKLQDFCGKNLRYSVLVY